MMKTLKIINQNGSCCTTNAIEVQETVNNSNKNLPIVIIGAGPIGLASAAHLVEQEQAFILLEAGYEIAHNIRTWGMLHYFHHGDITLIRSLKSFIRYFWLGRT